MEATSINGKTHVVVTGGAGFIGSALSARLLAAGAKVTILTRHTTAPRAQALAQQGATLVTWDVARANQTPALDGLPPAEMLLHLAADVGMASPALGQTNIIGTANVLTLAERLAIPYVLVASSIEAQGLAREDEIPLDEERPCRPVSEYGASKVAAEELVATWAPAGDHRAGVLRIGNVYGPGSPWLLRPSLLALLGATPLAPIYWQLHHRHFQPLYIDDLVEAVMRVATQRLTGLHNVTGETTVSIGHYLETLAALTGLGRQLAEIQSPAADGNPAGAGIDPDFAYLLMGTPDECHRVYDSQKIRRAIGPYARYDLRRGLAATLAWFHACGGLGQLIAAARQRQGAAACT